jgi:cell division septation protein DedD
MTPHPHPFDSEELGARDGELDGIAANLEGYASETTADPSRELVARIRSAVDAEADRRGPFAALLGSDRRPARLLVAIGLLALAVTGAVVVGQLANLARERIGSSPSPSIISTPNETPTPSSTPSSTPSMSETPSPSPSTTQPPSAPGSATPQPTPSARDGDTQTPHPSGSDNSGPGGGGGGNGGPGGGGSSGSGSGGD